METNKKINLSQLSIELNNAPLIMSETNGVLIIESCDNSINTEELHHAVNNHIAQPIAEPTIEEKLASLGLDLDNLKSALGL